MDFAQQLAAVLEQAKGKLEDEGHVLAGAVGDRLNELKPLLEQDAAAAEQMALDLVKTLFGDKG